MNTLTKSEWLAEVKRLAFEEFGFNCDAHVATDWEEYWRTYGADGVSPHDALKLKRGALPNTSNSATWSYSAAARTLFFGEVPFAIVSQEGNRPLSVEKQKDLLTTLNAGRDRESAMLEIISDAYDSTVDASTYPDGPCIASEIRQRMKAILGRE